MDVTPDSGCEREGPARIQFRLSLDSRERSRSSALSLTDPVQKPERTRAELREKLNRVLALRHNKGNPPANAWPRVACFPRSYHLVTIYCAVRSSDDFRPLSSGVFVVSP
ncbi:MAG: hypothetical protein QOD49_3047 [Actinomycetota bacterium]|jgi:hypothetical protein|nr:hypothetical protein [Actinomycetota bacterium]